MATISNPRSEEQPHAAGRLHHPLRNGARRRTTYWTATGAFALLFLGSAALTVLTPEESRRVTEFLGYPGWTVLPLAAAKFLGVLTILWGRRPTLTAFAFAGFLYDLVLAAGGHVSRDDPQLALAVLGLVLWAGAFTVDRLGWRRPGPG